MVNNELDLLRVKLEEAWEYVDRIYVAEADHTFTGQPKPMHLQENWGAFQDFADKIEHVRVQGPPLPQPQANEARLRNSAAPPALEDDDVLFCSDVDEIDISCQFPSIIELVRRQGAVRLLKRSFYYRVNLLAGEVHPWAIAARGDQVRKCPDLNTLRRANVSQGVLTLGGHFTYLMSAEEISAKIQASSHTELCRPEFTAIDRIGQRIDEHRDPFDRQPLAPVPVDATFPTAFHRADWAAWVHTPGESN
jgi:beta-1,4-mannosyl-glycoprotein beta-1,4-N-acetylglucosaminyltransferase